MEELQLIRYRTINECMAEYFGCKVSELKDLEGDFHTMWADGEKESWGVQESIALIRKRKIWAWIGDKKVIHFFIRKGVKLEHAVKVFAHEIGHMQRPFHRSLKEEQKANAYGDVAEMAYKIAKEVTEGLN